MKRRFQSRGVGGERESWGGSDVASQRASALPPPTTRTTTTTASTGRPRILCRRHYCLVRSAECHSVGHRALLHRLLFACCMGSVCVTPTCTRSDFVPLHERQTECIQKRMNECRTLFLPLHSKRSFPPAVDGVLHVRSRRVFSAFANAGLLGLLAWPTDDSRTSCLPLATQSPLLKWRLT